MYEFIYIHIHIYIYIYIHIHQYTYVHIYICIYMSFEFWVLSVEWWMLSVECWVLSVESWVLSLESWVLSVECEVLIVECWVLSVECWGRRVGCVGFYTNTSDFGSLIARLESDKEKNEQHPILWLACGSWNGGTADERGGKNLHGLKDVCIKNGSSQGQNLALTVLSVPSSLNSAMWGRLAGVRYRGTSLRRNRAPPGPCSSSMPRALWWSWRGVVFLSARNVL